ncbi:putative lipoprotein [Minicystis rosea]|nr:putative lipoprotein [Minicystis rosea]
MPFRFLRRLGLIAAGTVALSALALSTGAALSACGSDSTTGIRVTLKTRIVADDGVKAPFTNAYGWSIQLQKVAISVGALYYFDGAPIFSAGLPPRLHLGDFLLRSAHAHPGHYQTGNAMGQMLTPSSVDLALGDADLPAGEGTSGIFRSGRFVFGDKPTGSAASTLGDYVVLLEGEAKKDSMTRVFRAAGALADTLDSYGEPKLDGCAFDEDEIDVEANGTVTVHIKPSVWLDQSEFDEVPESTDGTPVELTPDEEAFKGFVRGLKKGSAVVFSYGVN